MFQRLNVMLCPLAVALALGTTSAWAQSWSSYEGAFPKLPCHDGWAGCVVEGGRVSPDMAASGPSDMRVDWFELSPTAAFSPFSGLSEYTGEVPDVGNDAAAAAVDDGAGSGAGGDDPNDGVAAAPSEEAAQASRAADDAAVAQADAERAEADARREEQAAQKASKDAQAAMAAAEKEEAKRKKEAARLEAAAGKADAAQKEQLKKEAAAAQRAADQAAKQRQEAQNAEAASRAAEAAAQKQAEAEKQKRRDAEAASAAASAEAKARADEDRKKREADEAARRASADKAAADKAEKDRIAAEKAQADKEAADQKAAAAAAAAAASQAAANQEAASQAQKEQAARDAEAAKKAEEERVAAEKASKEADNDAAAAANIAPPPAVDDGSCSDLQALEPASMLGKLSAGQSQCLETSLAATAKMTGRKKISVILMTNSFSKGDKDAWENLVKRHLDEIDQSDPDLCYKYALYLSSKGASRASGVIRWANVALENRTVWTGDTYKARVNSLYKMRAAASQKLWQSSEQEHSTSPSDATSSKIEKYRNMTKVSAREWYEYAKVSGKDTTKPLQLCMSAAGTSDYCDAG